MSLTCSPTDHAESGISELTKEYNSLLVFFPSNYFSPRLASVSVPQIGLLSHSYYPMLCLELSRRDEGFPAAAEPQSVPNLRQLY